MTIKGLLVGVLVGVAVALALGAAAPQPGRYQIAVSATPGVLYIARFDAQTGAVELLAPNLQDRRAVDNLIQVLSPKQ